MIDKERWERVESIYHAVLAREPDARATFLEQACEGDEELRNEVDSLLDFDGRAEGFMETPAIGLEAKAIAKDGDPGDEEIPLWKIGPYRLLSVISHGGMGDVFLAIDARLERKVAIKLLAPEFTTDPEQVLRFKQEARTTSSLSHPNIVTLFEIGETEGRHYIVTEYVEGETLRARLNGAPAKRLPLKDTLEIAAQVLEGLRAAHQAGVIHRDIKPENIVLRPDGLAKVLDFGIAKLATAASGSGVDHLTTRTGMIMGTASYMSPEQIRGQKVDHRADIFSVGAMLYEMLSGERPFAGETMQDVMAAVLIKEPKQLNSLVENLPAALQRIVERCLEKQPEKRFQTASDLAFSLEELSAAVAPTANGEKSSTGAGSRSSFSKKRFAILAAVLGVVAIALAAVLFKTSNARKLSVAALVPAVEKAPRVANTTTRLVWFDRSGTRLGTVGALGEYSGPALSPTEDRIAVALNNPKTRSRDLWIYPVLSESGVQVTADPADDLNPVWTPDGRWIIYTSERNGVRNIYRKLADGTGSIEPLLESTQRNNVEDISRDGRLLIFNTSDGQKGEPNLATLSLADLRRRPFRVSSTREDAGRFSPDGRWLAYRSYETGESEIYVRGISETGAPSNQKWLISNGRGGNTQPMWRGDGKVLYYLDHKVLTSAEISANGATFNSGPPTPLFKVNIEDSERRNRFLVTKDGERFLVIVRDEIKL
jgi:serine/threonine protein kinase